MRSTLNLFIIFIAPPHHRSIYVLNFCGVVFSAARPVVFYSLISTKRRSCAGNLAPLTLPAAFRTQNVLKMFETVPHIIRGLRNRDWLRNKIVFFVHFFFFLCSHPRLSSFAIFTPLTEFSPTLVSAALMKYVNRSTFARFLQRKSHAGHFRNRNVHARLCTVSSGAYARRATFCVLRQSF